jgi:hypothetical protein
MLYCQPEELAITAPQAGDILERYVKKFGRPLLFVNSRRGYVR